MKLFVKISTLFQYIHETHLFLISYFIEIDAMKFFNSKCNTSGHTWTALSDGASKWV
jgi:hypothetical protein